MAERINWWMTEAHKPEEIEVICSYDTARESTIMEHFHKVASEFQVKLVPQFDFPCIVNTLNRAAKFSKGDLLVCIADDLEPCKHWDKQLLDICDIYREQVIHVNDWTGTKETFIPIITRSRYQRYGYVLYPEYWSNYSDNDFSETARLDNVIVDAHHITFRHFHLGSESDDIYRKSNSPEFTSHNRMIYEWRKSINFGK